MPSAHIIKLNKQYYNFDKNMKKMDLLEVTQMSPNTLAKLGRNEDVSMDVLRRSYMKQDCSMIKQGHWNAGY